MRFTSTRNKNLNVGFEQVIRNCLPSDGGLYIPAEIGDLRRWILYTDETTTYSSVAGALTLACINEEFSPIICETIAAHAFPYAPVLRQLDRNLFMLELFHGPTGCERDFGVDYLVESLETILQLKDSSAIFIDVTKGTLGAVLARALKGKKYIKSVVLFPRGQVCGLSEADYAWNGGNIYPVEIDGTEADCRELVRKIFADRSVVENYRLTVANTANIGRLLPQAFFYPFAFSRLKKQVTGDIYYAVAPGNFSNVVAGLYSWRLAMPVSGFIVPATDSLTVDTLGNCAVLDSVVPLNEREPCDPSDPSNIERLEEVFSANPGMMRNLVYPAKVTEAETIASVKELFMKYKVSVDRDTAMAYCAARKHAQLVEQDGGALVVLAKNHPSFSSEYICHCLGECPDMPENVAGSIKPVILGRPLMRTSGEIMKVLESLV
jgi:threonine synthase